MKYLKGVQKIITFSPNLYHVGEEKAKKMGIPFAEYIRFLLLNDVKEEIETMQFVSEETEKKIEKGLEQLKKGEYTVLKNDKEIEDHYERSEGN